MILWFMATTLMISASFAEVGKISKLLVPGSAYISRNQEKITLAQDTLLEQGDELFTMDSVVVVYLYPSTQMSLSKNTQIKITESLIENSGDKEKYEKGLNDIQMKFNIGLGWFPDDENAMKIIGALSKKTKK